MKNSAIFGSGVAVGVAGFAVFSVVVIGLGALGAGLIIRDSIMDVALDLSEESTVE